MLRINWYVCNAHYNGCQCHYVTSQVEMVDEKLMQQFCGAALGTLPSLVAAVGGVVAQEALISLTGKFSPLHQWVSHHYHIGHVIHRDHHMTESCDHITPLLVM